LRARSLKTSEDFLIGVIPAPNDARNGTFYTIDGDKVAWTRVETTSGQYLAELHVYDLISRTDHALTAPSNGWPADLSLSTQSGVVVYSVPGQGWMALDWLQPEPTPLAVTPPADTAWGYELSVTGHYLLWRVYLNKDISESEAFVAEIMR
jgi:hypothetical protein